MSLACVASVSVWFRSKEKPRKGTFGFGRARNETRPALLLAPLFSRSLACLVGVERGRCFSPPPLPFLRLPRRLRGLWLSFFSAKPHRNACYAGYNLVWRGMWTSFLIQHGWPYDVLSLFHLYFVAATCCWKCTHGATTLLSLILSLIFRKLTVWHKANCCGDLSPRRVAASQRLIGLCVPATPAFTDLKPHDSRLFFDNLITR